MYFSVKKNRYFSVRNVNFSVVNLDMVRIWVSFFRVVTHNYGHQTLSERVSKQVVRIAMKLIEIFGWLWLLSEFSLLVIGFVDLLTT